jgi:hypothetical protein
MVEVLGDLNLGELTGFVQSTLPFCLLLSTLCESKSTNIAVSYLPWWGNGKPHSISPGYRSSDPQYVKSTVQRLKRLGVNVVVLNWFGFDDYQDSATRLMLQEIKKDGELKYILMIDRGAMRAAKCPECDGDREIQSIVDRWKSAMQNNINFKLSGRPVLFEFGLFEDAKLNYELFHRNNPEIALFGVHSTYMRRNPQGGVYAWPLPMACAELSIPIPCTESMLRDSTEKALSDLNNFYERAAKKDMPYIGGVFKGFDDRRAPWVVGEGSVIDGHCGRLWKSTWKVWEEVSTKSKTNLLHIATWNDHDENSGVEFGVDSCVGYSLRRVQANFWSIDVRNTENIDYLRLDFQGTDGAPAGGVCLPPDNAGKNKLISSYYFRSVSVSSMGLPGFVTPTMKFNLN